MLEQLKILMLEDSEADAEIVQRLLKKQNQDFEFMLAMDKNSYLLALDVFQPDVILADNSLPQFNAIEALEIINQRAAGIAFILVTGTVSEEFAANIIKSGADDYILKDRLGRLPAAIDAAVKQKRTESEKKAALDKLKLSENYFRSVIEQFPYPVVTYAPDGKFINANPAWEIMWQDKRENVTEYNIRKDPMMISSGLSLYVEKAFSGEVSESTPYLCDPAMIGKYGRSKWIQMLLYPLKNDQGEILEVILILLDITENKEAEEKIRESEEQLRQLSTHLQDIREEERAAMAREIHDVLGQQLTGFKMDMSWLNRRLLSATPDIKERMTGTLQLIDDTIKTVRKIATDLRPSILDDLGLVAALEWQSEEFEKRSGVKVYFTGTLQELIIEPQVSIALFRIYQELLTNVARHANATAVISSLHPDKGQLYLTVSDNGKGFDIENTGNKKTLGLLGIKERTLLMRGRSEIKSKGGEGTTVVVSIPFDN